MDSAICRTYLRYGPVNNQRTGAAEELDLIHGYGSASLMSDPAVPSCHCVSLQRQNLICNKALHLAFRRLRGPQIIALIQRELGWIL